MHYHIGGIATPLLSVNLLVYDIIVAMSGSQAVNSNIILEKFAGNFGKSLEIQRSCVIIL